VPRSIPIVLPIRCLLLYRLLIDVRRNLSVSMADVALGANAFADGFGAAGSAARRRAVD
jgi:hypothetical protein